MHRGIWIAALLMAGVVVYAVLPGGAQQATGDQFEKSGKIASKKKKNKKDSFIEGGSKEEIVPPKIAGEIAAGRVSGPERTADWPEIAVGADGTMWAVYVEWNGTNADRVVARQKPAGGDWGDAIAIDDGLWDHHVPAIVARPNGALAVWSGQNGEGYDVYAAAISNEGRVGEVERVSNAPHGNINVRAAADGELGGGAGEIHLTKNL